MSIGIFTAINNSTGTAVVTNFIFTNTVGISHSADLSNFGGSATELGNAIVSSSMAAGTAREFGVFYNTSTAIGGTYIGAIQVKATMDDASVEEENLTNYIYIAIPTPPGGGIPIGTNPAGGEIQYLGGGDGGGGTIGCSPGDTSNSCSASGDGGGGGGKVICTELYFQGFLDEKVFQLDQEFGKWLLKNNPTTYWGYRAWADILVRYMRGQGRPLFTELAFWLTIEQKQQLGKKIAVQVAKIIANPFANELARRMDKTTIRPFRLGGWLTVEIGLRICRIIGFLKKKRKKHAF